MKFEAKLESGILIRRYKRFLTDIKLPDKSERTIHCANNTLCEHWSDDWLRRTRQYGVFFNIQ